MNLRIIPILSPPPLTRMNSTFTFPPEIEEGNIEYKRQIHNLSNEKIIKFKTQMLWRMKEGKINSGMEEAIYHIGIEDDGSISGVSIESVNESLSNLHKIGQLCKTEIFSTQIHHTNNGVIAIVKIRKINDHVTVNDMRVCLLGASGNGKTTFIGVMTYDILDNGNGEARSNIFKYNHEKKNGVTSSIKYEIVGYNENSYLNYNSGFMGSWEYIAKNSKFIVNLIDLPGNSKYIKTALFGLMAHKPHYALIFIGLTNVHNENLSEETLLHIDLCHKLGIPMCFVFTKKDKIENDEMCVIINKVSMIIKKEISLISSMDDIICENKINAIAISNVTGENIDILKSFLQKIGKNIEIAKTENSPSNDFMINDVAMIPDIGTVVSGILNNGKINVDDKLLVGPINKTFYNASIISIHKKQVPNKCIYNNEMGSMVIKMDKNMDINKHCMIITPNQLCKFINSFKIIIMDCNYEFKNESSYMIFCGNVYDRIGVEKIKKSENEMILTVKFHNNNIQFIENNDYIAIRITNMHIIIGKVML